MSEWTWQEFLEWLDGCCCSGELPPGSCAGGVVVAAHAGAVTVRLDTGHAVRAALVPGAHPRPGERVQVCADGVHHVERRTAHQTRRPTFTPDDTPIAPPRPQRRYLPRRLPGWASIDPRISGPYNNDDKFYLLISPGFGPVSVNSVVHEFTVPVAAPGWVPNHFNLAMTTLDGHTVLTSTQYTRMTDGKTFNIGVKIHLSSPGGPADVVPLPNEWNHQFIVADHGTLISAYVSGGQEMVGGDYVPITVWDYTTFDMSGVQSFGGKLGGYPPFVTNTGTNRYVVFDQEHTVYYTFYSGDAEVVGYGRINRNGYALVYEPPPLGSNWVHEVQPGVWRAPTLPDYWQNTGIEIYGSSLPQPVNAHAVTGFAPVSDGGLYILGSFGPLQNADLTFADGRPIPGHGPGDISYGRTSTHIHVPGLSQADQQLLLEQGLRSSTVAEWAFPNRRLDLVRANTPLPIPPRPVETAELHPAGVSATGGAVLAGQLADTPLTARRLPGSGLSVTLPPGLTQTTVTFSFAQPPPLTGAEELIVALRANPRVPMTQPFGVQTGAVAQQSFHNTREITLTRVGNDDLTKPVTVIIPTARLWRIRIRLEF